MKLIHRMKLPLAIIREFGGAVENIGALTFLFCKEFIENNIYYDFIAQPEGPFSIQLNLDKEVLIKKRCLEKNCKWIVNNSIERIATSLDFFEKLGLQQMKNTWHGKSDEDMVRYLQNKYPEYFLDKTHDLDINEVGFYTIGYEGITPEIYLNKLLQKNVKLLCDVRKNAYSQKLGFSKSELKGSLERVGIQYLHIPELGIVSEKRQNLSTDSDYRLLFDEYEKEVLLKAQDKLDMLIVLMNKHKRIAITCFESKSFYCHRGRVADALEKMANFQCEIEHL